MSSSLQNRVRDNLYHYHYFRFMKINIKFVGSELQTTQFFKEVWLSMTTIKKIPYQEECRFDRTLTKVDVFLFCIGVVTASFYKEMPIIINDFGYMIFFPLLLAGMMSYITSKLHST